MENHSPVDPADCAAASYVVEIPLVFVQLAAVKRTETHTDGKATNVCDSQNIEQI